MVPHPGRRLIAQRDVMVLTAALMFGGAAIVNFIEAAIPGGEVLSLLPGLGAIGFAAAILLFGMRLPHRVLATLGPIGVALVAYALATTRGAGDGAALYMWPVLWESYFFGRRGAVAVVATVAVAHGVALLTPAGNAGALDAWIDVVSSVAVAGAVMQILSTSRSRLLDRVASEARLDELTGLLNRRGFEERAALELVRSGRERSPLALVAFDIDHFKSVNDRFGHQVGDRVLAGFAGRLLEQMRGSDAGARIGGDEFVVLLPGADAEQALRFAERACGALRSLELEDAPSITASAGVTAAVALGDIESLVRCADTALYAAKAQGRDRAVLASGADVAHHGSVAAGAR